MDLRQLEIFVRVAELKSFSKAADALFLTQPTVSEHIRTLEQELGVRLLDRLGRGAEATRAGQLLVTHATRILQLQREARQAMDQFQGKLVGELAVGASTIPGEYVL
ncbi:MAG TPA: LysR family transcriptional regulator, partial [Methylomirabilota bacterium]